MPSEAEHGRSQCGSVAPRGRAIAANDNRRISDKLAGLAAPFLPNF